MEDNGLRADQVKQVRGFADQQLRKPQDPTMQTSRVSVIVRYWRPRAEKEGIRPGRKKTEHGH